jgi:hypothetical protein
MTNMQQRLSFITTAFPFYYNNSKLERPVCVMIDPVITCIEQDLAAALVEVQQFTMPARGGDLT